MTRILRGNETKCSFIFVHYSCRFLFKRLQQVNICTALFFQRYIYSGSRIYRPDVFSDKPENLIRTHMQTHLNKLLLI